MIGPLISVIVPVYNVEPYLRQCIDSILNQSYICIEIILVDDGSPDNSGKICDQYAEIYSNIKVIHKKNGGLSSARNAGLAIAQGELIGFIDSDDFISSEMYANLYALIDRNKADVASCGMYRYNLAENICRINSKYFVGDEVIFSKHEILKLLLEEKIDCSSCNKLFRRDFFGGLKFKENRINEDFLLLFYLYRKCAKIVYTDKSFYYYRITPNSITNVFNEHSYDYILNGLDIKQSIMNNSLCLNDEIGGYLMGISAEYISQLIRFGLTKKEGEKYFSSLNVLKENWCYLYKVHVHILRIKRVKAMVILLSPEICKVVYKMKHCLIK